MRKYYQYRNVRRYNDLDKHCFYKNGKLHGELKRCHQNDILIKWRFYKNGEEHGEYKQWRIDGRLKIIQLFVYNEFTILYKT